MRGRLRGAPRALLVPLCLLGVLTGALAGATALAPGAYADRVTHRDAVHDVRSTVEGRPGSTAAPRRAEPDVRRIRIAHTLSRLRVRVDLDRVSATRNHAELLQIRMPGTTAGVYVTLIPGLGLESVSLIEGFGTVVDCPRMTHQLNPSAAVVTIEVPRGCLDEPRWVRVGYAMSWTTPQRAFSDDALSPRLTGLPRLTRRLSAG